MWNKIKAIIFDYGGTIDTGGVHWSVVFWRAYEEHSVPITEEDFREAYVFTERTLGKNPIIQPNYTFRKTLEIKVRIQTEHLVSQGVWNCTDFERLSRDAQIVETAYSTVVATIARIRPAVESLSKQLPLALVSNFYGNMSVVLEEFGLSDLFTTVVESAVVGVRKPDARIFLIASERLGVRPDEILVVGDSYDKDICPARKAGMHTAWLRVEGWIKAEPDSPECDVIIDEIDNLLKTNT